MSASSTLEQVLSRKFVLWIQSNPVYKLFNTSTEIETKVLDNERKSVKRTSLSNDEVWNYLHEIMGEERADEIHWIPAEESDLQYKTGDRDQYYGIGALQPLNSYRCLNKYLSDLNAYLQNGEPLLVCVETKDTRKERIFSRYPFGIKQGLYLVDFIINRVLPKLKMTRSIYNRLKKDKYRVLTLTESLARLVYTGYKIIDYRRIGGLTYILAEKEREPKTEHNLYYGMVIKLPRIGKHGKITYVYKIRTMHPYSEYLQEYMFEQFGTENGDKIENDFRKTRWGGFLRQYWLDEVPMIWNLLKGDIKIVGVRPLSQHKFDTYPQYLQEKRTQTTPGLIPPYYADIPETPEEFFETEDRYLESYFKHPIRTDIRYFLKSFYNIVIKGQRSK